MIAVECYICGECLPMGVAVSGPKNHPVHLECQFERVQTPADGRYL